ncbi:hypothetical protein D478_12186 [Brevibacillus agri BAB-2500]|nr:hypothetical protein D478_12186 [Brevibacillus agri BAB-2500]
MFGPFFLRGRKGQACGRQAHKLATSLSKSCASKDGKKRLPHSRLFKRKRQCLLAHGENQAGVGGRSKAKKSKYFG